MASATPAQWEVGALKLAPMPEQVTGGEQSTAPVVSAAAVRSAATTTTTPDDKNLLLARPRAMKKCTMPDCESFARSRGRCKAHGGGKRCNKLGCELSDQGGGFCIRHGGGRRCEVDGCVKSAQSRRFCKAHGGGMRCRVEGCTKTSQGGGCCRAHGGGPRLKKQENDGSTKDGEVAILLSEPILAASEARKPVKRRTDAALAPSSSESGTSRSPCKTQSQKKENPLVTARGHPVAAHEQVSVLRKTRSASKSSDSGVTPSPLHSMDKAWCRIDGCGDAVPASHDASQLCEEHGTNLHVAASLLGMLSTESA